MKHLNQLIVAATFAFITSGFAVAEEAGKGGFELGILTCKSEPGTRENYIVASKVQVSCEFKYNNGKVERYVGETGVGVGLDLNWKREDTLAYTVMAASQDTTPGAGSLAGKFAGGKGSVTLGYGAGAGVLVGGGKENLSLQPLALEGSKGLGIAAGVSYLTLDPEK